MSGWIKIHRDINKHWIWVSDRRLKWWIDILITVNHADSKVLINGKLYDCNRGQSLMSLETWAKRWGVTRKTVKDFFFLLQSDSMLVSESIRFSTRITVCNYDTYQSEVNAQETLTTLRSTRRQHTNKNDKNKENDKNNTNSVPEILISGDKKDFIDSLIFEFQKAYREKSGIDYEILNKGKERSSAATILKIYKEKYPESTTNETILGLSVFFNQCVNINEPWLSEKMSLPIIVNQFNQITKYLKNGNQRTKTNGGATTEQLASIVHKNFAKAE